MVVRIDVSLSFSAHPRVRCAPYTGVMKKQLIVGMMVVAVALASSTAAWAQVGGGIKAGVNFAKVSGSDEDPGQRIGAVAGAFLTIGLGSVFAIQPETVFSMQGTKFSFGTAKVDYVQVPLLLRIGSSPKASASVYGLVGPSVGLYVRDEGFTDDLKRTDVGLVVGAGVTLSRFLVEARYTAGLTEFSKGTTAYKHRVWSLMAGLHF